MTRRVTASVVVIVGLVLVGVTVFSHLFTVGPAFESLTKDFRPVMQTTNLRAMQQDVAQLGAAAQEFQTKLLPMYAAQAKVTPAVAATQLGQAFPDVFKGISQAPAIATQFNGVINTLTAEQQRFARADSIPTTSLPATTVPWSLLAAGVVLILLGALMVRPGFTAAWVTAVFGVILIAAPLVLSLPGKASAADTMNSNLKPVYTSQMVTGAEASLVTIQAMGTEMQTKALPAFAQQFGMTPAQLQQTLSQVAPNLAGAIGNLPTALQRFTATVKAFRAQLAHYNSLKPVKLLPIVWELIIGGALSVIAAFALLLERRPRPAVVHIEHPKAA